MYLTLYFDYHPNYNSKEECYRARWGVSRHIELFSLPRCRVSRHLRTHSTLPQSAAIMGKWELAPPLVHVHLRVRVLSSAKDKINISWRVQECCCSRGGEDDG